MNSKPGDITLTSGRNSRYKVEVFPRIFLKSDKPSLWKRIGYFLFLGSRVIKLPDIDKCEHVFQVKTSTHYATGKDVMYEECVICEYERDLPNEKQG